MAKIYVSKTGRQSYSLLTLLNASLLDIWYCLSDAELAQSLFRDILFRKFCHLELGGDVPDATTIGRFRGRLMELGLWKILLGEVNHQLEAKHIIMTEGRINIIDANSVETAQSGYGKDANDEPKRDKDAGWHAKANSRGDIKSTFGYSVHTGVDEDGFIHRQTVTPGNAHDSTERGHAITG
ncbi:MAG: IS5 family transposase [Alteromonas macleodii]|jgi:IS5 family transposase